MYLPPRLRHSQHHPTSNEELDSHRLLLDPRPLLLMHFLRLCIDLCSLLRVRERNLPVTRRRLRALPLLAMPRDLLYVRRNSRCVFSFISVFVSDAALSRGIWDARGIRQVPAPRGRRRRARRAPQWRLGPGRQLAHGLVVLGTRVRALTSGSEGRRTSLQHSQSAP